MRYIGNKENLTDFIYETLKDNGVDGESLFDFFSGTASVAKFFKEKGFKIYSSDIMYFSYVLQEAYIKNNGYPEFKKLLNKITVIPTTLIYKNYDLVLTYLNNLKGKKGFIYQNYSPGGTKELDKPRMYLSDENAMKIDAIRSIIEEWKKEELINHNEYYVLLATLLESVSFYTNVAGVYAAFSKKWDPRALKPFEMRSISLIEGNQQHEVFCADSMELLDKVEADIIYLDPPYNQRQYAPNYHLLETIAKYDSPDIYGVAGLRPYDEQKSTFCNAVTALRDLEIIAKEGNYKYLVLSYNNEGIMQEEDIKEVLSKYGDLKLIEKTYGRFKSHSRTKNAAKKVREQLYILKNSYIREF